MVCSILSGWILRLRLRDCREQDDGEGVGDGGRKEDKGECHACENSVNTDRFNPREPGEEKLVRYKDGFEALEKAEREAIRHEGECQGKKRRKQRGGVDTGHGSFRRWRGRFHLTGKIRIGFVRDRPPGNRL